ncbi:MAG TPA: DUF3160 domain-containing protein [Holophagaceae bacterium]|nr:DUF3160 domain-containing protein [Holophagaceae bacterium]
MALNIQGRTRLGLGLLIVAGLGATGYGVTRWMAARRASGGPSTTTHHLDTPDDRLMTLDFQPRLQEGDLPLASAKNLEAIEKVFQIRLSRAQREYLNTHKFLLVPMVGTKLSATLNHDEMLQAFDDIGGSSMPEYRAPENAKLITPDVALHAFHRYFSMTLEELEKSALRAHLSTFLTGMVQQAGAARSGAPEAAQAGLARIQAHFAVASALLATCGAEPPEYFENPETEAAYREADAKSDGVGLAQATLAPLLGDLPEALKRQAEEEVALIYAAQAQVASPLFGGYDPKARADYSQYTPRGYYEKRSALRAYFRTMIYLGRNAYALKDEQGLKDALLMAGLFPRKDASGRPLAESWQKVMDLTALYAGPSDDLTYPEWSGFLRTTLGTESPSLQMAMDPASLARIRTEASRLPAPRILSELTADPVRSKQPLPDRLAEGLGFRVFGQRFSYDAWILNRFTAGAKLPPTALYVPAALGDAQARIHAEALIAKDPGAGPDGTARFLTGLQTLQGDLAKEPQGAWERSMAGSWLQVLGTLTHTYGPGFPRYMQSEPFRDKQLQTFLGSYTELKHDTLLYAKPSYAEMGEGGDGPIPPLVKGFVEPNLPFWARLAELVKRTGTFFDRHGLFKEGIARYRLEEFGKQVTFFHNLAVKELKAEPISEDDYEHLRTLNLAYMAEPLSGTIDITEDTGKVGLVADIHTDGTTGKVLYEGTGRPYLMLVLVGNEASPRVTVGLAYNHVEFQAPLQGPRLTDEAWRKRAYATPAQVPPKNTWYRRLAIP